MSRIRTLATMPLAVPGDDAGRVLIVSNRLPVTVSATEHSAELRASSGGLATGLTGVARRWPALWFGWAGSPADVSAFQSDTGRVHGGSIVTVPLTEGDICRYYRRYSSSLLWPVLHDATDQLLPEPEDWSTYVRVNQRFARRVAQQIEPGDRVWIHDYHLMLVPSMVRELRPDARIAFFLHTPFPEAHAFARIPQSQELLAGMLGADLIGFHTPGYARRFLATVESELAHCVQDNTIDMGFRTAEVRVGPMGIDVASFTRLALDPNVLAEVSRLRSQSGRMRMLGVDRLDYTKGIPQRLVAFERLLETHPELHRRVSLVQIAVPSREDVRAYRDLRDHVESIVHRINQRYGRAGWTPVDYFYGTVDLPTLVGLYRAADVMLVTPLRDGMNLVAKEFVASRADLDGVLVLSEFAGAAVELHAALLVNPNRTDQLATAYYDALVMPRTERRARMRRLRRAVEANNVFHWAASFLEALPSCVEAQA